MVLSGTAFAHCLAVVEFLHAYGKLIGLDVPKDIPSLATLQEGLLGLGDSQGEVQDLLIKLTEAALHDPGLPSYYQVRHCPLSVPSFNSPCPVVTASVSTSVGEDPRGQAGRVAADTQHSFGGATHLPGVSQFRHGRVQRHEDQNI